MILRAPGPEWADVAHGFTGRAGGVSAGPYQSLNLSFAVGDDPEHVARNWDVVRAAVPRSTAFAQMRQVHGRTVRVATPGKLDLGAADAAIAATPGVAVSVLTADCVPVLLSAAAGSIVAAVHAGWRGTAVDVVGDTVRLFESQFGVSPATIDAALGPAIGACCYAVGSDVVDAMREQPALVAAGASVVAADAGGAWRVDLRAANRALLGAAGLDGDRIRSVGPCTRCRANAFFSHRAAGGGPSGRQLTWIVAA